MQYCAFRTQSPSSAVHTILSTNQDRSFFSCTHYTKDKSRSWFIFSIVCTAEGGWPHYYVILGLMTTKMMHKSILKRKSSIFSTQNKRLLNCTQTAALTYNNIDGWCIPNLLIMQCAIMHGFIMEGHNDNNNYYYQKRKLARNNVFILTFCGRCKKQTLWPTITVLEAQTNRFKNILHSIILKLRYCTEVSVHGKTAAANLKLYQMGCF